MFRFITPIILIAVAIASFFLLANPLYNQITDLRASAGAYDEALSNSKALENERDKLTAKYNAIEPGDLEKIKKLLPDNIDNIRLILEIGQIATPYGMVLKGVKYSSPTVLANQGAPGSIEGANVVTQAAQGYGVWDLEFSVTGSYNNFLNFLKDIESNLRIVDVSSVSFSSEVGDKLSALSDTYTYNFKIKTYWLKN